MPQYARPDGDIDIGLWVVDPLWSKVDEEVPNGTDIMQTNDNPSNAGCEISISTLTSAVSRNTRLLSYRYRRSAAGGEQNLNVVVKDNGVDVLSFSHGNVPANWTLAVQRIDTPSIVATDSLSVKFVAHMVVTSNVRANIDWVQLEGYIQSKPAVIGGPRGFRAG